MNEVDKATKLLQTHIAQTYSISETESAELTAATITIGLLLTARGQGPLNLDQKDYVFGNTQITAFLPHPEFLPLYREVHQLSPYAANALFQELLLKNMAPHLSGGLQEHVQHS